MGFRGSTIPPYKHSLHTYYQADRYKQEREMLEKWAVIFCVKVNASLSNEEVKKLLNKRIKRVTRGVPHD